MAYIKLNKENFYHNLCQIATKTGSIEKIAIVLKDNAYGHGLLQMAEMASDFGIRHAVVRDEREAKEIVALFENILVLGGSITPIRGCSYAINSLDDIKHAPISTRVELKVDTGMHRNGIDVGEVAQALSMIESQKLKLVGVMTHYRSADVLSSELFWQQKTFASIKQVIAEAGYRDIRIHSCNSTAILRANRFDEDLVRVGIAAYGYNELDSIYDVVELRPVLSLYACKVSSRPLKSSQRVGYGGKFKSCRDMMISTYDLGYGDGWCRGDSSHPYITVEGLPILGRVSMDMISLESSKDEICIMANAQEAAKHFNTISYEMTTSLSTTIRREIV